MSIHCMIFEVCLIKLTINNKRPRFETDLFMYSSRKHLFFKKNKGNLVILTNFYFSKMQQIM